MFKYKFTVFTPTYNREDKLYRVYDSLKNQCYRDFEWLIVDDGSEDKTKEIIDNWIKEDNFDIRYLYQENSGKHIAINNGVKNAHGELFLIADSDDLFLADALHILNDTWETIDDKDNYSSISGLCIDSKTKEIIGNKFPKDVFDSNMLESNHKHNIQGEKWGFQRTNVLKEFPFPSYKNEKFVLEGLVWNRIANKYKTRFINKVLRVYYQDTSNSLSSNNKITNPNCMVDYFLEEFKFAGKYFYQKKEYKKIILKLIILGKMQIFSSFSFLYPFNKLNIKEKFLFTFLYPLSCILAIKNKLEGRV